MGHLFRRGRPRLLSHSWFLLACLLFAGTLSMFWLGYRATVEWDRSTEQLVQSRGREILALLSAAIDQDMKGGQIDLLLPINGLILKESSLYDLADRFAGGLARFPYIESVYVWKAAGAGGEQLFFFNRLERVPPWDDDSRKGDWYPVIVQTGPTKPAGLVAASRIGSESGSPFSVSVGSIGSTPYQVIAHRIFADDGSLLAIVGLTVNLDWVFGHYFGPLIQQIQQVGRDASVRLEIRNEGDRVVAATGPAASREPLPPHFFPLVFAQRSLTSGSVLAHVSWWSARVDVATDATLVAARRGTLRTLTLLSGAVGATIVALLLAVRAARAAATLAARQSDFVSAVSHEMKTPLSLITLASDSLASGRCSSPASAKEYGRLLATEARQLAMLIDNVLCYARLIDEENSTSLERVDVAEVLGESIDRFRVQCERSGCEIQLESSLSREVVEADRRMLRDAFDNIVDNAIKYGGNDGRIVVSLRVDGPWLCVDVTDHGEGIAARDLPHVFEKFRRGSAVAHDYRGSGLGLTIARRVIEAHRGRISITSRVGEGTTVHVQLPLAPAHSGKIESPNRDLPSDAAFQD
jgi:signal transduction histidine kinase